MKEFIKKAKCFTDKNEKAFTLIEMLGVIVIIGLILIVAIPNLAKILNGNKEQEFDSYYDLVEEAALVYAGKITDELGTSKHSGCKDITLDELIKEGYVQKFNDSSIMCSTEDLIRIRNEQGKITVTFELYCNEEEEEVYRKGKSDTTSTCEPYTEKTKTNLKLMLESDETVIKARPVGSKVFIASTTEGNSPNNYIWYSGKLWRAINYDRVTEHVTAVTVDSITSIYYSHNNSTYPNSDVNTWINNDFYNSLKNPSQFLVSNTWYYSSNQYDKKKVGIISPTDLDYIYEWYGGKYTWLSDGRYYGKTSSGADGIIPTTATSIFGVRPVVTFSADLLVESGSGTETDPYIIDNTANAFGKAGELINTRYSGEYVKVGEKLYRIVSVSDDGYTKLIGTTSEGDYVFSNETTGHTYDFTVSNVKNKLLESFSDNTFITAQGQFCLDTINNANLTYHSSKRCITEGRLRESKVGLPQIGDLFTSYIEGIEDNYWTINPNTEIDSNGKQYNATINTILPTGQVGVSTITDSNTAVVVFYLDSNVKIKSGNGMKNTPYELQ